MYTKCIGIGVWHSFHFQHSVIAMEPKAKKVKTDPGPIKGQKMMTSFFKAVNSGNSTEFLN